MLLAWPAAVAHADALPAAARADALPAAARADALPAAAFADALQLARHAAAQSAPSNARIVVTPGALDSRMRLAPCAKVQAHLAAGQPAWGHTRVGLRCVARDPRSPGWQIYLPVQVQVLAPAWISRTPLPVGARISKPHWNLGEADWAAPGGQPVAELDESRTLARALAAGQALKAADLTPRRWFDSGQNVSVVAHGAGFAVRTEGRALNHGIEGVPVRVRTEGGRIVEGRATAPGRVDLAP
jgi:flagella basal body P-ring formation protein FlgA